jgi:DNA-binding NarL/FixJ family response regulator
MGQRPERSDEAATPRRSAMKVVVANQPRILRESIAMAITTLNEVEVVIGAAHEAAILRSVKQHKPDCLILSLEFRDANPRLCRAVLTQHPQTFILAIGPRTLTVYWFEVIVRSAHKECSLSTILEILRANAPELKNESAAKPERHHEEMLPSSLPATVSEANHYEP